MDLVSDHVGFICCAQVKALSEELENPLNVHRWRKLEGSDPSTYEMIQKIQTLQKRLIAKTEEVVEKDLLIQEKEKLYMELKNILARQPGPEVAEQLSVYQANLREKTKQMKAMASELNMYQAQVRKETRQRFRFNSNTCIRARWKPHQPCLICATHKALSSHNPHNPCFAGQ